MTKSTIPRKQLIKKAQEQIEFCRHTKITGEGRAHVNQCAALFEIALAAMDGEPVAWRWRWSDDAEGYWRYTEEQRETHGSVTAQPLYRHAQPAPVVEREPIAWLNDAYLARGVVDGEAGSEDAGPGYIPVYREAGPQPAPVVPDFKKLARELVDNLVDCGGLDEGVKEKYLEWAEKTCRAAMLAATPQEVK
ncbi:hypothetical protein [Klebsiella variicola]|uniref:hypothetical protein n=1 Tax=Klebsiella variicola TaxID=244366 RepID=UPI003479E33D